MEDSFVDIKVGENNFKYHVNRKIEKNNEREIVDFLNKYFLYVQENSEYIFKIAFSKRLDQVIEYLRNHTKYKNKDLINWAIKAGNIEWVKKQINFNNYTNGKKINGSNFLASLYSLRLDVNVLDEICIYDKINYDLGNGYRYLQTRIRANPADDKSNFILRFINNVSPEELNTPELDGSTALDIAEFTIQETDVEKNKVAAKKIIEALLERGADYQLPRIDQVADSGLTCHQLYLKTEDIENLKQAITEYVDLKNEEAIINLLKDQSPKYHLFVKNYLPYIFKAVFNEDLRKVLKYIKLNCLNDTGNKIKCALKIGDIDKIKLLTQFNKFVVKDSLIISGYRDHLKTFTSDPLILEKILSRTGEHWEDNETGQLYLNVLLQRKALDNKYKKIILRSISNLTSAAINLQDKQTKNTALHEALYAFDRYKKIEDQESIKNIKDIIKALLKKKANLTIPNAKNNLPKDFLYFTVKQELEKTSQSSPDQDNSNLEPKDQAELQNRPAIQSNQVEVNFSTTPKNNLSEIPRAKYSITNKIIIFGGISIIAGFILYKIFESTEKINVVKDIGTLN